MIITRSPLRISLGGGGTDLPSYYRKFGGFVVSAAINKYIYIGINRIFSSDYVVKYSELEKVGTIAEIRHPIVREALAKHGVEPAVEIVSLADMPSGTGLGSSGTFTVGLLRALYAHKREHVTAGALAEEACQIEIDCLNRAVGKQDQYISAFGGLTCFEFGKDDRVHAAPLVVSQDTLHDLEENLLLFFTGYSRDADQILEDQKKRSDDGDAVLLENLHGVAQLGWQTKDALEKGDTGRFADIMHEHWEIKKRRLASSSSNAEEDLSRWYEVGRKNGARGGKIVGAGGGGFLMFYADDRSSLRKAMAQEGLDEVRFTFDHDGSTVINRD